MIEEPEPPESEENPLAGVLDRLLRREHDPFRAGSRSVGETWRSAPVERLAVRTEPVARRMLAVAGLATVGDSPVLRHAAQWAAVLGRRPSITDLTCPERGPGGFEHEGTPGSTGDVRVARAHVPCGPERIRREPAEIALALLERLRRH